MPLEYPLQAGPAITVQRMERKLDLTIPDGKEFSTSDHDELSAIGWEMPNMFGVWVQQTIEVENGEKHEKIVDVRDTLDVSKHSDYVRGSLRFTLRLRVQKNEDGTYARRTLQSADESDQENNGMLPGVKFGPEPLTQQQCEQILETAEGHFRARLADVFTQKKFILAAFVDDQGFSGPIPGKSAV